MEFEEIESSNEEINEEDLQNETMESTKSEEEKEELSSTISETPTKKILTENKVRKFNEESEKKGIVYLSRIPPKMTPSQLRKLMSDLGEVGRIFLVPESKLKSFLNFFLIDFFLFIFKFSRTSSY